MTFRMKLLDYSLLTALAAMAAPAIASTPELAGDDIKLDCDAADGCRDDAGRQVLKVIADGAHNPVTVGTSAYSSSEALQPDRRVVVSQQASPQAQPGRAEVVGKWSVNLPGGGVVWATEDPNLGQPELNVSAPAIVPFDGKRITKPVPFYVQNNYSAFIRDAEVVLYRASDKDLTHPIASVALPVGAFGSAEWDGVLPTSLQLHAGDELTYILRAHGASGAFDETYPRRLQLVRPEDAERNAQQLRNNMERKYSDALSADQAQQQSLIDQAYAENSLRVQNIAVRGSRVRIQGRSLPEGYTLTINGQTQPIDLQRKMVAEYLMPIGDHKFDLLLSGPNGQKTSHLLDVNVSGHYFFATGIADVTVSRNSSSSSVETSDSQRQNDNFLYDGRLAFYMKAKYAGKYLVTAQADTQERQVDQLFTGFWKADARDVFRDLDPNLYYPVYGDDSNTYRDVDTQGRLYLRVDWDKNQALWGNFNTGLTGTEYGQYSRALYGGAIDWRSQRTTDLGNPGSEVRAFASQAQSAPGHAEFVGTGGSLYYLRNTDILPGSERLVIEVRDNTTGRVENRIELQRGADYQINDIQGRLQLTRPLLTRAERSNVPRLTSDVPLDGLTQVLLVDYEYVPTGFHPDEVTAGLRGKQWFGDHVAVGGTYVQENRAGEDYTLKGVDLTLQQGRGTYLKIEQNRTEATSVPGYFSDNGGLSFFKLNPNDGPRQGNAQAIEARANLRELGWTQRDWAVGAWHRQVDAGYSVARQDIGEAILENGVEMQGELNDLLQLYTRVSRAERGAESLTQSQLTGEWRINDKNTLSGELRRVEERRHAGAYGDDAGTLGAFRYMSQLGSNLELYGIAQKTLDDDHGRYRDNDMLSLGSRYVFGDRSNVGAEVSNGDRGNAAQVNAEYQLSPEHSLYSAYTYSTDQTQYDPLFNPRQTAGWTLGQRWRLSNTINLFNESQFLKEPNESGLAHTYGMDFYPGSGWNLGFTLQHAQLNREDGEVKRNAASLSVGRTSTATQWQSKLEWRADRGVEHLDQWVTTNRFEHKFNDSFRVAARANYAKTIDQHDASAGARYAEGNVGFAWRPSYDNRWALFGKYTYLYDVAALSQIGPNTAYYDQRTQILSLEGVYKLDQHWEFAAKAMHRRGEVRFGRMEGQWFDSAATFAAGQVRYRFAKDWHAMAEYRRLSVKEGGTKHGFLAGIDRDIGKNLRVGVGYNFTGFTDDLTDFRYNHRGVFLNMVGKY